MLESRDMWKLWVNSFDLSTGDIMLYVADVTNNEYNGFNHERLNDDEIIYLMLWQVAEKFVDGGECIASLRKQLE